MIAPTSCPSATPAHGVSTAIGYLILQVRVNTNISVIMMAKKIADHIKAEKHGSI